MSLPSRGAAKAGIEAGDIIEFINGETIVQFEDLRLQIAQYRAGEKLNVGIIRNGEAMEVEVELGDANTAPRKPALITCPFRLRACLENMTGLPVGSVGRSNC